MTEDKEMPETIWVWEYKETNPEDGTDYYENGWHRDGEMVVDCLEYRAVNPDTVTISRAELEKIKDRLQGGAMITNREPEQNLGHDYCLNEANKVLIEVAWEVDKLLGEE